MKIGFALGGGGITGGAFHAGVISALYSVGPILEGIGLNITAWSFCDKLGVSVLGCPASLPDPWALTTQFEAELHDLRQRLG